MDKEIIKERISVLKQQIQNIWLAIIAVSGAISAVFISIPDTKSNIIAVIFKVIFLLPAIAADILLFALYTQINKDINILLNKMENRND